MRGCLCTLFVVSAAACAAHPGRPTGAAEPASGSGATAATDADHGAILGLVRDEGTGGNPVSFARVVAFSPAPPARGTDVSDAQGRYRVGGLLPGKYRVTASLGSMEISFDEILVEAGRETKLNFVFDSRAQRERAAAGDGPEAPDAAPRAGAIYGRITDQVSGGPFPGAVVSAYYPGLEDAPLTVADEHGRYRLAGLRPETYTLSIYYQLVDRGAIEIRRSGVVVAPGEATRIDLEIDTRLKR